jgi:copper chaperone
MITTLKVDGMTCGHCVQAVSTALKAVPGVERAMVVLESGLAEVEGDAPADALVAAVQEEGYQARVA